MDVNVGRELNLLCVFMADVERMKNYNADYSDFQINFLLIQ